jgi:hypothetical protein
VALFSREQVRRVFFADGRGTKHALAEILAKKFPEELGSRLPPNSPSKNATFYTQLLE